MAPQSIFFYISAASIVEKTKLATWHLVATWLANKKNKQKKNFNNPIWPRNPNPSTMKRQSKTTGFERGNTYQWGNILSHNTGSSFRQANVCPFTLLSATLPLHLLRLSHQLGRYFTVIPVTPDSDQGKQRLFLFWKNSKVSVKFVGNKSICRLCHFSAANTLQFT